MGTGLPNRILVKITAADIPWFLTVLHSAGIAVHNVKKTDEMTLRLEIIPGDLGKLQKTAQRCGANMEIIRASGIHKNVNSILGRPVLLFGILIMFVLTVYLPTRVLFVEVQGNTTVADGKILESASLCGVHWGASRRSLRSEEIKNRLLQIMPELEWVGINSFGCRAVISVTERDQGMPSGENNSVSSIVAARDGVITSCTVTNGNLLCKPGQAVTAGQKLVSGYTDCGITIQATQAEGEIYALTMRTVEVVTPGNCDKKGEKGQTEKKYSLILGKKRINFYKDSGILNTTCDKMYTEYVLTLPGGFQLPVILLVQTQISHPWRQTGVQLHPVSQIAEETARNYLQQQMISGVIENGSVSESYENGVYTLKGDYRCREMIGRIHSEEILDIHGKNN